ncbi:MAG: flagellar basal body P-ring protein FlgI [Phycisphaeraceae bacterium]|nr:flagellar basal body P-ring protein FlgI [Phycisphaeraceae bacterium]
MQVRPLSACCRRIARSVLPPRCSFRAISGVALVPAIVGWLLLIGLPAGCAQQQHTVDIPPPPALHGPEYLHGTVGSYTRPRGLTPIAVGGYGVVVNLNGTGSSDVPSYLRANIENRMRRYGFGNPEMGGEGLIPRRVLASSRTSIVEVRGVIPPAAPRGSRFDLVVTAEPSTQTISLQGGMLWTTELSETGLNRDGLWTKPEAMGQGALLIDPFAEDKPEDERFKLEREAVVLAGGVVQRDRPVELVLNRPDARLARMMAGRINQRFPRETTDRLDTAVALSDEVVRINVPSRYFGEPLRLLEKIQYTFVGHYDGFEAEKAREMGGLLVKDPSKAKVVANVWEVLGRTALPEIANYYDHSDPEVRFAALQAGSRLGDRATMRRLIEHARDPHPELRLRAAELMVVFPREQEITTALGRLLSDSDRRVRIEAYETLSAQDSRLIESRTFGEGSNAKFRLDLVPAERPLIYISQVRTPRIVIFSPDTGFRTPALVRLWNDRLMLRAPSSQEMLSVFYQPYRGSNRTPTIAPTVANLIWLLGHRPTMERPQMGLDLSFSEVANAVYQLHRKGVLEAEVEVQLSPLAALLARYKDSPSSVHPEFADDAGLIPVSREFDALDEGDEDDPFIPIPMPLTGHDAFMDDEPRQGDSRRGDGSGDAARGSRDSGGIRDSGRSGGGGEEDWDLPIPLPDDPKRDHARGSLEEDDLPIPLPLD